MAFLDNSGDIILDAVLTDTGRMRLAKGDGSFRITKFALGDDEINYKLYNKNDPRGSQYFDVDVMSTPVFEAFTNNISSLNSRLITITRSNLLFLPVLKINNIFQSNNNFADPSIILNGYLMSADNDTSRLLSDSTVTYKGVKVASKGVLNGSFPQAGAQIRIDQGIDNIQIPGSMDIDPDLKETQYLIEVDNRIASIVSIDGTRATPSYIDDDDIAAYYFSLGVNNDFVSNGIKDTSTPAPGQVIAGARGTVLEFCLSANLEIATSPYLFNQLGNDETSSFQVTPSKTFNNVRSILTSVTVTGLTTGYSVQIPVMVFKYIS